MQRAAVVVSVGDPLNEDMRFWPPQPVPGPTEYRQGQRLSGELKDLIDKNARVNVVLVVSQNCQFCLKSVDFYRRLAALPATREGRMRIAFIGFSFEDAKAFVTMNQLPIGDLRPTPDGLSEKVRLHGSGAMCIEFAQ